MSHKSICSFFSRMVSIMVILAGLGLGLTMFPIQAWAGPPFLTDDPEPVEYKHGEVYLATQFRYDRDAGKSMTLPHMEVNYGLLPNLQIHLITPFAYIRPTGGDAHYGYGDTEVGAKYRFIQESELCPMVATFPLLEIPTGNKDNGLGSGEVQAFIPLWLQKSWGPWTTYGGGGYWINPGAGRNNYGFFGWAVQRELTKQLTLGTELYHKMSSEDGGESETGFNVGAIVNFTENHHLLFSAGRDISGSNLFSGYLAYQFTFGP
ncbi:MAG: transporter [Deltaproteobacteria bacterium]|nr:transporter [Deltaproteobacteria bacterium]